MESETPMRNTFNPSTVVESMNTELPIVLKTRTHCDPETFRPLALAVWFEVGGACVGNVAYVPVDEEPTIKNIFRAAMKGAMGDV
jgi:hypothetical protein